MRRAVIAVAALVPLLSSAQDAADPALSQAAEHAPRLYAFAQAGAIVALNDDLELLGFDHGPALEVGVGFRLARHVAVEASAGYVAFSSERTGRVRVFESPEAPVVEFRWTNGLSAIPLLASMRVSAQWGRVEVHALGGGGVYLTSYDARTVWTTSPTTAGDFHGTDTSFGVHAGAGVAVALSRELTIGADATYLRATATFAKDPQGSTTVTDVDLTARLDSLVVAGTATYRF